MSKLSLMTATVGTLIFVAPVQAANPVCAGSTPTECVIVTSAWEIHYCDRNSNQDVTYADYYLRSASQGIRLAGSSPLDCDSDDVAEYCKEKPAPVVCNGKINK